MGGEAEGVVGVMVAAVLEQDMYRRIMWTRGTQRVPKTSHEPPPPHAKRARRVAPAREKGPALLSGKSDAQPFLEQDEV
ncbi:hypothetical protein T484DRAFT_1932775 [Baffinella frigidus]|nr:hypothetical protein T484DRAFT_1932775 [Cryptophyta sp. CCMP2293]